MINEIYSGLLPKEIQFPNDFHNWRFNIKVKNKQKVLACIFEQQLFASSHYASIAHLFSPQSAPVAEQVHNNIVNLFNDFRFSEDMASRLCHVVNQNN